MTSDSTEAPTPAADAHGRPASPLPRGVIVLVGAAAACIAVAGLRSASGIVGPAFLALVLTVVAHPVRLYVQRRGWPGWTGVLIGMESSTSILIALTLALVVSLARLATLLPEYKEDAVEVVDDITNALDQYGVGEAQQETVAGAFDLEKFTTFIVDILGNLASLTSNLFFVITLLFFMAIDASWFPTRLREAPARRGDLVAAFSSFADGTRRYLVVSTIFGLIVAIIDTAFLAFIGIPAAFVWGLLAFITNYIPNVGFVIGLIPPAVLDARGRAGHDAARHRGLLRRQLRDSVTDPAEVRRRRGGAVRHHDDAVPGVLGVGARRRSALLAIPLTLVVKAFLVDADPRMRWLLPILSGDPANPPEHPDQPEQPEQPEPGQDIGVANCSALCAATLGEHMSSRLAHLCLKRQETITLCYCQPVNMSGR